MVVTRPHTPCDFLIFQLISSPCASSFSFIVHSPAVCRFFTIVSLPCCLNPEIWISIVSHACPSSHHLFYLYNLGKTLTIAHQLAAHLASFPEPETTSPARKRSLLTVFSLYVNKPVNMIAVSVWHLGPSLVPASWPCDKMSLDFYCP